MPFPAPGIFPTQGSNPGLPHCRQTLLPPEPPGKPISCPEKYPAPPSCRSHDPRVSRLEQSRLRALLGASPSPSSATQAAPATLKDYSPRYAPRGYRSHVTALLRLPRPRDSGKMAALTAENFAALQNLLKVNGRAGGSAGRAFVSETLDRAGVENKPTLIWSHDSATASHCDPWQGVAPFRAF